MITPLQNLKDYKQLRSQYNNEAATLILVQSDESKYLVMVGYNQQDDR